MGPKKKLWLTYAWKDNEESDVDYVIQELERRGVSVRYDKVHLMSGERLWPALDRGITDPSESDAWAIFATENSLKSEACLEEIAYALDRALRTRGSDFPLIGIFPRRMDRKLIPSAIATRLWVSLDDPKWADRVAEDLLGKPKTRSLDVLPFVTSWHNHKNGKVTFEARPRAGSWYPALVFVKKAERHLLDIVEQGPPGMPPPSSITGSGEIGTNDGKYLGLSVDHAIDNSLSLYAHFHSRPSQILFGKEGEIYEYPAMTITTYK